MISPKLLKKIQIFGEIHVSLTSLADAHTAFATVKLKYNNTEYNSIEAFLNAFATNNLSIYCSKFEFDLNALLQYEEVEFPAPPITVWQLIQDSDDLPINQQSLANAYDLDYIDTQTVGMERYRLLGSLQPYAVDSSPATETYAIHYYRSSKIWRINGDKRNPGLMFSDEAFADPANRTAIAIHTMSETDIANVRILGTFNATVEFMEVLTED